MKSFIGALAITVCAAAASAEECITERVVNVPDGWVRARPGMNEKALWKLAEGSTVKYCGESTSDKRSPPIIWHWVSFKSKEEPWEHEGWMSSRILAPVKQGQGMAATPPDPQSSIPDKGATVTSPDPNQPPIAQPGRSAAADTGTAEQKVDKKDILALVARATIITRASRLCPQYNYGTEKFSNTIARARELVGDKAVDKQISETNEIIVAFIASDNKNMFCEAALNSDAELEDALK